jgi:hypothetical protein
MHWNPYETPASRLAEARAQAHAVSRTGARDPGPWGDPGPPQPLARTEAR